VIQNNPLSLLHPQIRAFVQRQGWDRLRPIQEQSVPVILQTDRDVIISAPTSGGKTEAAFLPIISAILERKAPSFQVLYVSPLKALINDQFQRLSAMLEGTGLPVHRWHADVDNHRKKLLRNHPAGVLQITPESLESSLINFGHRVQHIYGTLDFIVIDELHSFLESERGIHLRSLLSRIRRITGRDPRHIGLSATLADANAAQRFLRPEAPERVQVIQERGVRECNVMLKTVCAENTSDHEGKGAPADVLDQVAVDIDHHFGSSTNLVFANSRRTVEALAVRLKELTGPTNRYHLHHGSLSREVRFMTEAALKSAEPANAVATSSLELGIDIGEIEAVAQIDPPNSVSALVQRVGRSGRRAGQTATLHLYVRADAPPPDPGLTDLLAPDLLQGMALIQLMQRGWLEPPQADRFHLSTLIHQSLSLLKQYGGLPPNTMHRTLCEAGPFRKVSVSAFAALMAGLDAEAVTRTDGEGYKILSLQGEKITSAPDFYAAFTAPVELAVRNGSEQIGKLPTGFGLKEGDTILLDARRWEVRAIEWKKKTIWVKPARFASLPVFLGQGGDVHTEVYKEMARILKGGDVPDWLDERSAGLLGEARRTATHCGLHTSEVLASGNQIHWFPWVGTRGLGTLALWAKSKKIEFSLDCLSIRYSGMAIGDFKRHLAEFEQSDPVALARLLPNRHREKFDRFVTPELLDKANATDRLDMIGARAAARAALVSLG
jgi:ATP-dependent Lhr-like helicase